MKHMERHFGISQLSIKHLIHQLCVLYCQMLTLPGIICEPLHNTDAKINVHTVGFHIDLNVWGQWTSAMSLKGLRAMSFKFPHQPCAPSTAIFSTYSTVQNKKKYCEHIIINHYWNYLCAFFSLLMFYSIINLIYFLKKPCSHCLFENSQIRYI